MKTYDPGPSSNIPSLMLNQVLVAHLVYEIGNAQLEDSSSRQMEKSEGRRVCSSWRHAFFQNVCRGSWISPELLTVEDNYWFLHIT